MVIRIAESAGFCFGVNRAVDEVYRLIETSDVPVFTYGELIHNRTVTDELERRGVSVISGIDELPRAIGGVLVIRSHGVQPEVTEQCERLGLKYIDMTCPCVAKIHKLVEDNAKSGHRIIVVGDAKHPEVIATVGWARGAAVVFANDNDAMNFQYDAASYVIVAQTTIKTAAFETVTAIVSERAKANKFTLTVHNTICGATSSHQKEAAELARESDIMIVLGDPKSSNTLKLYEICAAICKKTYLIRTIHEFRLNILRKDDKIGLTAGASTPPVTIKEAYMTMSEHDENLGKNTDTPETAANTTTAQPTADMPKDRPETFESLLEESLVTLNTGDVVKGTVIQVQNGEVSVNLNYKSDGIISKGEFSDNPHSDPEQEVKPGDEVDVFVVRVNDGDGNVMLSRKKIAQQRGWAEVEAAVASGEPVVGKVIEVIKGGLIAMIHGVRAFVPQSQVAERFTQDLEQFVGNEYNFNVLEYNKQKRRVVAGRRELSAKEATSKREKLFETLEVGQVVSGVVSRIVNFGAFVDLGGADGLIHISELSWGRVKRVTDVLAEGDKVEATVLAVDKEKGKISLSLREVKANPWDNIYDKYPIGSIVTGTVARIAPFGAFIELEEGLDGLVHVSQIAEYRVNKPEDALAIGDVIHVVVTDIDPESKRVSLSKRAADSAMMDVEDDGAYDDADYPEDSEE